MDIIQIKNLTISFSANPEHCALQGINLSIPKASIMGLVGESGSGKTLTGYSLLRLLPKTAVVKSGAIQFIKEGQVLNLLELPEEPLRSIRGRHISMIFQEAMSALNPILRCGDQVTEVIKAHFNYPTATMKDMVLDTYQKVGLKDPLRIYQSYPFELSGGQVQRVLIAQAIINKPSLIIADEPTTALDVNMQKKVVELLQNVQQETNCSILFISHDLGLIRELCSSVAVMHKGQVVEMDIASNIYQHAKNPYTKSLMLCKPPLRKKVKKLISIEEIATKPNEQVRFEVINTTELNQKKEKLFASPSILDVQNLHVAYQKQSLFGFQKQPMLTAVTDVSFKIRSGEVLGLVGESGSGKSSIGKSIVRLINPTSGSILFNGQDMSKLSDNHLKPLRKEIQMVFQDPYSSLNPRQKIGMAIQEPMEIHKLFANQNERKAKAIELLQAVGLSADHYHRFPHQFSGGQRQRICIARALSVNPKLLVCDEPVSALDVSVQAQILNLFKVLQDQYQLSYLFISHDLAGVHYMADRIIVLQNGKTVEEGWASELIQNPQTSYTASLIDASPKDFAIAL